MSKKFSAGDILKPAIVLTMICLVTSALLAYTNSLTAPVIEQNNIKAANEAKAVVLPEAENFTDDKKEDIAYSEGTDANGEVVGYVFTTSAKSYGGDISVMVGVKNDGSVAGIEILSINDTPGLGMNAKDPTFLEQFLGLTAGIMVSKNDPGDNDIQALTGATVTSKAVAQAVNQALDSHNNLLNILMRGENNG